MEVISAYIGTGTVSGKIWFVYIHLGFIVIKDAPILASVLVSLLIVRISVLY